MVDGGSCAPEYNRQGEIKFEVLLEAFRQMKYDAISIGEREILMHRDTYDVCEKLKATGIPIVTLNIVYGGERLRDKPLIIRRDGVRVGVFSLLLSGNIPQSAKKDWTIKDPEKVINAALRYTRNRADFVIAMLQGNLPQARAFVKKHKGMDIVIVSYSTTSLMKPEKINDSLLIATMNQGKFLGRVDASLKEKTWEFDPHMIALDKSVPTDPVLTKTYEQYLKRVAQLTEEITQKKENEPAAQFPSVLQATDCRSCHTDIYDAWAKTPHAHAIESLTKKNEQQNPECIVCHTTYYLKGGFVSLEKTPEYAGIQCTQCHGRMDGHTEFHLGTSQIADAPPSVNKDLCLQCHTSERDHDFNFERDKKKIH